MFLQATTPSVLCFKALNHQKIPPTLIYFGFHTRHGENVPAGNHPSLFGLC